MDAFEGIVSRILEKRGYWVRKSVKVVCSADEKATYGSRTAPTPEIDLVAYDGSELMLVEVKSFLDSDGVKLAGVDGTNPTDAKKYRLVNDTVYQALMSSKIAQAFGIPPETKTVYCLAAGNIYPPDLPGIMAYFAGNTSLRLITPGELADGLENFAGDVYVSDEVIMTVKLLKNEKRLK